MFSCREVAILFRAVREFLGSRGFTCSWVDEVFDLDWALISPRGLSVGSFIGQSDC